MKNFIIALVLIILVAVGIYYVAKKSPDVSTQEPATQTATTTDQTNKPTDQQPNQQVSPSGIELPPGAIAVDAKHSVLGESVEGREIIAYHYGSTAATSTDLLFIGGIHGGYEWNTTLVARELMNYLEQNPSVIPSGLRVTVVPLMNPDGMVETFGTTTGIGKDSLPSSQEKVVAGRFNANEVDLNRNFDCGWKSVGVWQSHSVSGGDAPFSEPESKIIQAYVESTRPDGVVVWYSSAGGVFASNCYGEVPETTKEMTDVFAKASGYRAYQEFDFYEVTGDMVNWMAKLNIPAISVLLSNHENTEWSKNRAGVEALFEYFSE